MGTFELPNDCTVIPLGQGERLPFWRRAYGGYRQALIESVNSGEKILDVAGRRSTLVTDSVSAARVRPTRCGSLAHSCRDPALPT